MLDHTSITMAQSSLFGLCMICQVETKIHCSLCADTFYCSKEHQKEHWKIHKQTCPGKKETAVKPKPYSTGEGESDIKLPPADAWAIGLSGKHRYEWFVNSYRLRVDDDYVWGGGYLHGLYAEDSTPWSIMIDFLVYCKFAVKNGVIPTPWNWNQLLKEAKGLLNYAFEKSDAREKYGGENVFAELMGGRSLRNTSGRVYGFLHGEQENEMYLDVDNIERSVIIEMKKHKEKKTDLDKQYFDDVGGSEVWRKLEAQLKCK